MGGLVFGPRMVDAKMIHNLDLGSLIEDMHLLQQGRRKVAEYF